LIDPTAAAAALEGVVRRTPVVSVAREDLGLAPGAPIQCKLEYLQYSGTFKARGASHFMVRNDIGPAGVVAASGGNHGAAVAWAARARGYEANIFVPTISSPAKVDRLRSYGATVHQVGAVYSESLEASRTFEAASGATSIHAYDHPDVMAGAGTTGPTNAYAAARAAGEPVDVAVSGVTADALGATRIGTLAWNALSAIDAPSALVADDAVMEARQLLWSALRIVVEPAVATTVAALTSGAYEPAPDERVGIVLCGANTRLDDLT